MSKFYPKKNRKHTHCPWCKAGEDVRTYVPSSYSKDPNQRIKPRHRNWFCGSSLHGKLPWQSKDCEINVLEKQVEELSQHITWSRGGMT